MARAKKKAKTKPKTKTKPGRKPAPKKRTPRAPKKAPKRPAKSRKGESDVEKRWREYWECRKSLEEAVEEVRTAEDQLAATRQIERERRAVFDRTKADLKNLLEVEPASSGSGGSSSLRSVPQLGFIDPEDEADKDDDDEEEEGDEDAGS